MVFELIAIGIFIGSLVYQRLTATKPHIERAKKTKFSQDAIPRTEEGAPVTLFWGTVRIRSPIVIWAGQFKTISISPTGDLVGNDQEAVGSEAFRVGQHLLLGIPGSSPDTAYPCSLSKFWIGDDLVKWAFDTDIVQSYDALQSVVFSAYISHGSEMRYVARGTGGAWHCPQGWLGLLSGTSSQTLASVNATQLTSDGIDATLIPSYRNQAIVCLRGGRSYTGEGDFNNNDGSNGALIGSNPSLEPYSFEVSAPAKNLAVGPAVSGGDANPISILYDILTNEWARVGIPASQIDTPSFLAAGTTLAAENHGMSLMIPTTMEAREAIDLILSQIDGALYEDTATGKYKVKLFRDDYSIGSLPLFNEANIVEVASYATSTWSELPNQIRVIYTSRAKDYQDRVAMAQDQAAIIASGGKIRSREIRYPGCMTEELAEKLAARELRGYSLPLIKARLVVNRDAYTVRPGDVIRWSWSEWGIVDMPLRVLKYDAGTLDNGRIVLDCVQDRFAFEHTSLHVPNLEVLAQQTNWIPTTRIVDEAPRFFVYRMQKANSAVDTDDPHAWFLLKNRDGDGAASTWSIDISQDSGGTFESGINRVRRGAGVSFPPTFEMDADYLRTVPASGDAYDTGTGMVIRNCTGWTPADIPSIGDTTTYGAGLLRVNDEVLAFETVTSLGSGVYRLNNVSRGMVDTVPGDHLEGDIGFVLYNTSTRRLSLSTLGTHSLNSGDEILARCTVTGILARSGAIAPERDWDPLTISGRAAKALPPASLTLNSSRAPAAIEEDAVIVSYKHRDWTRNILSFPYSSPHAMESGTTLDIYARKGDGPEYLVADGVTSMTTAGTVAVGAAGHGTIEVFVRAENASGSSHYDNGLSIVAYDWRNLLLNPRFASSTTAWTLSAGTLSTPSPGIGGGGNYAISNSAASTDIRQTRDITGYRPRRMSALLTGYMKNQNADAGDTLALSLTSFNVSGVQQDDVTTGAVAASTSTWSKSTLTIPNLDVDTTQLRARFVQVAVGDSNPDTAITELIMRVGQFSIQSLSNPDFESGGLSGWTASVGTMTVETTTPYTGANYARGGASPGSVYYQQVSIPAGYEVGCDVMVECARMHDATGDTGQVSVQVRDSGGSVLTSDQTAAEDISPINVWVRRRVFTSMPNDGTANNVRVFMTSSSGAGTANACYDDFDMRFYKHLDPDTEHEYDFNDATALARIAQPLPANQDHWNRAFPDVDVPDYGFYVGNSVAGVLGIEPALEVDPDATLEPFTGGRFTGAYDPTNAAEASVPTWSDTAYGFPFTCDGRFIALDPAYANFTADQDWTVLVAFKADGPYGGGGARDIVSRHSGGRGWAFSLNGAGALQGVFQGNGATISVTRGSQYNDGSLRLAALVYDSTAQTLRVVTKDGSTSTSTASMGDPSITGPYYFSIGGGYNVTEWRGQIARVYLWKSVIPTADLQACMTHGNTPHADLTHTRSGTIAVITAPHNATNGGGVQVSRFSADQCPWAYASKEGTSSNGLGLPIQASAANIIAEATQQDMTDSSVWVSQSVGNLSRRYGVNPEGMRRSAYFDGTSSTGFEMQSVTVSATSTVRVIWFAKAPVAHSARIELRNSSGSSIATQDYSVTTEWRMFQHNFTTWNGSTATCRIRFCPSNDGNVRALEISGPYFVGQGITDDLVAIPMGVPGGSTTTSWSALDLTVTMPLQFNHEGEMRVEAWGIKDAPGATPTILDASNGSNNNDLRRLYIDGSPGLAFYHADSAGTIVSSETTAQTWSGSAPWVVRGRWCRAGLLDASSAFAGCIFGDQLSDPADYDRTSTWTAGTSAIDAVRIGGSAPASMVVGSVILRTREEILGS